MYGIVDSLRKYNEKLVSWISNSIGLEIDVSSSNTNNKWYSDKLSRMMTGMFENTKVDVYIIKSNRINAYTFPGIRYYFNSPLYSICNFFKIIGIGFPLEMMVMMLERTITSGLQPFQNTEPSYDRDAKKIRLNLSQVTISVTKGAVEKLSDNEIKAVFLHEVGHNLNVAWTSLEEVMRFPGSVSFGTFMFGGEVLLIISFYNLLTGQDNKFHHHLSDLQHKFIMGILAVAVISWILVLFTMFISKYARKQSEIKSDEFAAKCGYGKYLADALEKMNKHRKKYRGEDRKQIPSTYTSDFAMMRLKPILSWVKSIFRNTYGSGYPERQERLNKLRKYDVNMKINT